MVSRPNSETDCGSYFTVAPQERTLSTRQSKSEQKGVLRMHVFSYPSYHSSRVLAPPAALGRCNDISFLEERAEKYVRLSQLEVIPGHCTVRPLSQLGQCNNKEL
jgi:hypothetical protein